MRLFDKIFRDKNGNIVIIQFPNIPIIIFVISLPLRAITHGSLQTTIDLIGLTALVVFGLLELFSGVNYFRKAFGLAVLVYVVVTRIWLR